MKLLLTSNGLSNQKIADALFDLVGKPAGETRIAFVPTAMNVGTSSKEWFINDLVNIQNQRPGFIDIVDISALPQNIWQAKFVQSDVLFFCGGNTSHLMRWIQESGLEKELPALLESRVYAGISAGSIVTNPTLALSSQDKKEYYEQLSGYRNDKGLGYVDFYIRPHYNSPKFPHATREHIEKQSHEVDGTIYGIDDDTTIRVDGDVVDVVSEGDWIQV